MKTAIYKLPTHWASSLIYGDSSGLEDSEIKKINEFLDWGIQEHKTFYCVGISDNNWISRYDGLLTDVSDYTFFVEIDF